MLLAGLDFGASKVIGIEKEEKYIRLTEKRLVQCQWKQQTGGTQEEHA
jgi:hypothetical protein